MADIDKFPCYGHYDEKNPRCNPNCPDAGMCELAVRRVKEIKDDQTTTPIGGSIDLYS